MNKETICPLMSKVVKIDDDRAAPADFTVEFVTCQRNRCEFWEVDERGVAGCAATGTTDKAIVVELKNIGDALWKAQGYN